ncbi:hypothetical protein N2152v2_002204 [Parachlorella kessleri]
MRIPASGELEPLRKRFRKLPAALLEVLEACLQPDPSRRPTAAALMQMPYFSNSTKWLSVEFQQAQERAREELEQRISAYSKRRRLQQGSMNAEHLEHGGPPAPSPSSFWRTGQGKQHRRTPTATAGLDMLQPALAGELSASSVLSVVSLGPNTTADAHADEGKKLRHAATINVRAGPLSLDGNSLAVTSISGIPTPIGASRRSPPPGNTVHKHVPRSDVSILGPEESISTFLGRHRHEQQGQPGGGAGQLPKAGSLAAGGSPKGLASVPELMSPRLLGRNITSRFAPLQRWLPLSGAAAAADLHGE